MPTRPVKPTAVLIACLLAGGCGGSSSSSRDQVPEPPAPPQNRSPAISGNPPVAVVEGEAYDFTPQATDADGDALTFSVANAPAWSQFDTATGRLWGTPGDADVGTDTGVSISVSDGSASSSLPPFDIAVRAAPPGSATLSWTPPSLSADQSPLDDLAGYRLYYSTVEGDYVDFVEIPTPSTTTWELDDLSRGTWFFVITAYDLAGNESDFSLSASKTVN